MHSDFVFINTGWMQRFIKSESLLLLSPLNTENPSVISRRIDFSELCMLSHCIIFITVLGVDIFSPRCVFLGNLPILHSDLIRLDISPNSIHTKRRIWQESVSALLLTDKGCRIPIKQEMVFTESRDSEYPPYLIDFIGTPGERYAENLKVS
jgi:hypothetical protein